MEFLFLGLVCIAFSIFWGRKKAKDAQELWMAQLEYRLQENTASVNRASVSNAKLLGDCLKTLKSIEHYEKASYEIASEDKNKARKIEREIEDSEFAQYREELNPEPQWLPKANIRK